jgi:hypothetical protein
MDACMPLLYSCHASACCCTAGGFLTYNNDVPKCLLTKSGPRTGRVDMNNTLGHWDLINHQLRQVWPVEVMHGSASASVQPFTVLLWCFTLNMSPICWC